MSLKVNPVLCRAGVMDNYAYIITDEKTGVSAVIDASEAEPVILKCRELGLKPKYILTTHHHSERMKPAPARRGSARPMEVWNADMPFDGSDGSKNRPVVILGRSGDGYNVMMITTHPHDPGTFMKPMEPYDAGLDSRSHIRTDKKYRIPESRLNYYMGDLGDDDAAVIEAKYGRMKGS